jgi:dihydrolipoamide dehydrogenase
MPQTYDVVVIGSGPGGYIAAVRAGQLGLSTACIEGWRNARGELTLGGTCLNVGCIPSKALLATSHEYERASHLEAHGITVSGVKIDIAKMQARKDAVVAKMTKGIEFLFRKNKVTWVRGFGRFKGREGEAFAIEVSGEGEPQVVLARHVIVATGSKVRLLPGAVIDNRLICDNEGALAFAEAPKRLGVIGAGVIGLELGSVWRRLGAQVTILEALPAFLGAADEAVAKEAWKQFTQVQGLDIRMGVKIGKVATGKAGVAVEYTDAEGAAKRLECDKLVVSIGRVPNTEGLAPETIGLELDERGFIQVDERCRTAVANVYAIGDVVRGPMLAHKAEDEGVMAAELIAGQQPHVDYAAIPWIIYTDPEIAWVGLGERQAKAQGIATKAGQFPFSINGRALGTGETVGFAKVVADAATDRVLGVHVIHAHASDIIQEAVTTMEFAGSAEDIARIVHAHPTLSEAVREAALNVDKRSLNM